MTTFLYHLIITPLVLLIEFVFSVAWRVCVSPGLAIVFVSIAINILILPLYQTADRLQQEERDRQQAMSHWVEHIKKTFSGDEQYMMLTTYYRQQNYKPIYALKSSLSLVLQIPFFIAAYNFLSNLAILKGASFLFLENLGAPDQLFSVAGFTVNVMPILMTLINIGSSAIYTKGLSFRDKIQTYALALMFLVLLYQSPSGLVLYWTCNQVFSLIKNAFTKLVPNPRKVLAKVIQVLVVLIIIWMYATHRVTSVRRIATLVVFIVLGCLVSFRLLKPNASASQSLDTDSKQATPLLIASGALLVALVGVLVPSAYIGASPTEFMDVADYVNPLAHVVDTVATSAGLFLLWVGVFYYLSSAQTRQIMSVALAVVAGCALATYLLFGKDLGVISTSLIFDEDPSYSRREVLLNCGLLLAIAVGLVVISRSVPKILPPAMGIIALAVAGAAFPNISVIMDADQQTRAAIAQSRTDSGPNPYFDEDGNVIPTIHLSQTGKNVVVLFLDRGISGYLPFMLAERPDLAEALDGFTYYPNAISYGPRTVFGSPSILGGYDYSLEAMNARSDELLVDKHNEAAQLLPILFSQEGFKSTLLDESLINYDMWTADYSLFKTIPNVTAYRTEGVYNSVALTEIDTVAKENFTRNLFLYGLFKCAPVGLQPFIYDEGTYWTTLVNHSLNTEFLNNYSTLVELPELTYIDDDYAGSYVHVHTLTTHTTDILQLPEYEPALYLIEYPEDFSRFTLPDGRTVSMDSRTNRAHYHCFVSTFQLLATWFDYIKAQGVWDNTRVIIVSDHGYELGQFDELIYDDYLDIEAVNALLLVKDFDSEGELQTSDEFMTTADTAWMATNGIVVDPINPFTGNPINDSDKQNPQVVTTSVLWDTVTYQQGTVFDTYDGYFYSVHDNIFDLNNWQRVEYDANGTFVPAE